jgi:hypothetical protein
MGARLLGRQALDNPRLIPMTHNHWRAIAILGGLAIGFFMTTTIGGYTTYVASIYNSGASSGGSSSNTA